MGFLQPWRPLRRESPPSFWMKDKRPGGHLYAQYNPGFKVSEGKILGPDYERGQAFLKRFAQYGRKIRYMDDTMVFGIFDGCKLAVKCGAQGGILSFRKLILAPGAHDRPVPFPGWTLPGVFTAGGAQMLVKMQRVLPGRRILLSGTGPLQLVLACQILDAGGEIAEILEAGDIENWIAAAKGFWKNWDLLSDAISYVRRIRRFKVPLKRRHIIVEVRGKNCVEEAIVAEVDSDWRPKHETRRTIPVDAVCIGYGLVPSVELSRLAGCRHRYEPRLGGWIPERDENMETTIPEVYAVGDGSGIAGSQAAVQEGGIAAVAAAQSLGYLSEEEARSRKHPFRDKLEILGRLRKMLDDISVPRPGLYELATDNTVICRCEEVTIGDLKKVIQDGVWDVNEIKRLTRMGMGRCQGRMCATVVQETVARVRGIHAEEPGYLIQRPPVKPVTMGVLNSFDGKHLVKV